MLVEGRFAMGGNGPLEGRGRENQYVIRRVAEESVGVGRFP